MREIREIPGHSFVYTKEELEKQRMSKVLDERVIEAMCLLVLAMPECNNWLTLKKALMLEIPVHLRQLFSKRHDKTKKHFPFNNFENLVRKEWFRLTSIKLEMPKEKIMEEVDPRLYL